MSTEIPIPAAVGALLALIVLVWSLSRRRRRLLVAAFLLGSVLAGFAIGAAALS